MSEPLMVIVGEQSARLAKVALQAVRWISVPANSKMVLVT